MMSPLKKISIIVPVYNTGIYLDRCMESLVKQSLRDFEIIIVDDGSEEICSRQCDQWAVKDNRICVIHKKNEGLGYARNTGIAAAEGEYVAFVDSDDYIAPDMCEKLYDRAKASNADLVVGGYIKKYDSGYEQCFRNEGIPDKIIGEDVIRILLANMLGSRPEDRYDDRIGMSVWKNLYSRQLFDNEDVRFPSEREYISEDIIFHIRCLKYVRSAEVLHAPVYYYCQNAGSLSKSYRSDRFEKIIRLFCYEKKLLKEMGAYQYGKLPLQRTLIANVRTCIMMEASVGRRNGEAGKSKRKILAYCRESHISEVLREYPWQKLPVKQRIFSLAMLLKWKNILYILACLQNRYRGGN